MKRSRNKSTRKFFPPKKVTKENPNHAFAEKVGSAIGHLGYLAAEAGPQYWDLNFEGEDDTVPRAVVIAISGNDEEIEKAIEVVRGIRSQQSDRGCVYNAELKLSNIDD